MKTLYISDLDGTLLKSDETLSEYTLHVIKNMAEKGELFSYATARSYVTASKVTKGLDVRIPLIVHNGAVVVESGTGSVLLLSHFKEDVHTLIADLIASGVWPTVYTYVDGKEEYSYVPEKSSSGMKRFLATRKNDPREQRVQEAKDLYQGKIFNIACIDDEYKLKTLFSKYALRHHCLFERDFYSGDTWLEIMPKGATKAAAVRKLKEQLHCDRIVAFGDGKNDMELFLEADESYAVANAAPQLKAIATGIINSNDEDGVAAWLDNHVLK